MQILISKDIILTLLFDSRHKSIHIFYAWKSQSFIHSVVNFQVEEPFRIEEDFIGFFQGVKILSLTIIDKIIDLLSWNSLWFLIPRHELNSQRMLCKCLVFLFQ